MAASVLLAACTTERASTARLPDDAVPAALVPRDAAIALYVPQRTASFRYYEERRGAWIDIGPAIDEAISAVANSYFPESLSARAQPARAFGLLLKIDPDWEVKDGRIEMTMPYELFDGAGKSLRRGNKAFSGSRGDLGTANGYYNVALRATQLVVAEVVTAVEPTAARFPAVGRLDSIDRDQVANLRQEVESGTGIYVNASGTILTPAHIVDDCLVVRVQSAGPPRELQVTAISRLLDLAVLEGGSVPSPSVPLRSSQALLLGEEVVAAGISNLSESPSSLNVARGSVVSLEGLRGSLGLFQFAAPRMPGVSGAAVLSASGELVGVGVIPPNEKRLTDKGVLTPFSNFALDVKHVVDFLRRQGIPFADDDASEIDPSAPGSAARNAIVRVSCYQ